MRIVFLNPQGNFDANDRYWTEHPDFGGQLVYVKEIALALSELGHDVDIITRRFDDEKLSGFSSALDHYEGYPSLRIVRIDAGPNRFIEKEQLWEYLCEWVNNIVAFYHTNHQSIDFITTHYGDGGIAGAMLSEKLDVPFSFTGHSLGAQKMEKLNLSRDSAEALNARYQFSKRLMAERTAIKWASIIFTSTPQERDEQYLHPAYQDVSKPNAHAFVVAPPGVNEKIFGANIQNPTEAQTYKVLDHALVRDIDKSRLDLPYIVLASRLDQKKNHLGVLKAFARSQALQQIANIAISVRGVDDVFSSYANLKGEEKELIEAMLAFISAHDLTGKVTFVNLPSQHGLASAYRYFAALKSVFALTSTYEPFGLAPIEAMCAGLPVAVTQYGGPADVLKDEDGTYGVLLDVTDDDAVMKGLIQLFKYYESYKTEGMIRVKNHYTWKATAKKYMAAIENVVKLHHTRTLSIPDYFKSPSDFLDFGLTPIQTYFLNSAKLH